GFQDIDPNAVQPDKNLSNMQTSGLFYQLNKVPIQIQVSGYYQLGKNEAKEKVSAYLLSAGIDWKVSPKLGLGIRSDYLSGNTIDQPASQSHSFSTLFGKGFRAGNGFYFCL